MNSNFIIGRTSLVRARKLLFICIVSQWYCWVCSLNIFSCANSARLERYKKGLNLTFTCAIGIIISSFIVTYLCLGIWLDAHSVEYHFFSFTVHDHSTLCFALLVSLLKFEMASVYTGEFFIPKIHQTRSRFVQRLVELMWFFSSALNLSQR